MSTATKANTVSAMDIDSRVDAYTWSIADLRTALYPRLAPIANDLFERGTEHLLRQRAARYFRAAARAGRSLSASAARARSRR